MIIGYSRVAEAMDISHYDSNGGDNTDATSYNLFAAVAPPADSFMVAIVVCTGTADPGAAPTFVGFGATWTLQVTRRFSNSDLWRIYLFTAPMGSSPSAAQPSISGLAATTTGCIAELFKVTGHAVVGTVVQSLATSNAGPNNPISATLAALDPNNGYIGAVSAALSAGTFVDPPTGWTEAAETGMVLPTAALETTFRVGGESGTSISWNTSLSLWGAVFVELKKA